MTQYKVRTPVVGFTGEVAGVIFVKGEATVDDTVTEHIAALQFFRRRGYGIRKIDVEPEAAAVPDIADEGSCLPSDDPSFGGRPKDPADAVPVTTGEESGSEPEPASPAPETSAPEPAAPVPPAPEPPARPAGNASKDDWAAYACAVLLLPAEEATALTRTELVALVDAHDKETQHS